MAIPWIIMLLTAPVILDNGSLRVEADPEQFAIRFVGTAANQNFLDPMLQTHTKDSNRDGMSPGGLVTYLISPDKPEPVPVQGPAEILRQDKLRLTLLGPAVPGLPVRIQEEIQLAESGLQATFIVTVLSSSNQPCKLAIRNTARIPEGYTVRSSGTETLKNLHGGIDVSKINVVAKDAVLLPIPPREPVTHTLLGAFAPQIALQTGTEIWTRAAAEFFASRQQFPEKNSVLCHLDGEKTGLHPVGARAVQRSGRQHPFFLSRNLVV